MLLKFLLSTISSNTGSSSESKEKRFLYPLEMDIGATQFGIRRKVFAMGASDTVQSSVKLKIEVEWTCLAET